MKIHYFSGSDLQGRKANSVHVMHMCEAFAKLGHDVTLMVSKSGGTKGELFARYGVEEIFEIVENKQSKIPMIGGIIYGIRMVLASFRTGPCDLYYGRHVYTMAILSALKKSIVIEQHGIHRKAIVRGLVKWMVKLLSTKGLVVISATLKRDYQQLLSYNLAQKIIVAHDGAPDPGPSEKRYPVRNKTENQFRVGYVGHLYPGKGMEVVSSVSKLDPESEFVVVGGNEKDLEYWRQECKNENLNFTGYIPHNKIRAEMSKFDVVLLPNQTKVQIDKGTDIGRWTSPLKMFEYMAAGLPIIASDIEVLREVLTNEHNSLLVAPDDPHAWVEAIKALKQNPAKRKKLGEQAKKDLISQYTWTKRAEMILDKLGLS